MKPRMNPPPRLRCVWLHRPFTEQVKNEGVTALYSGISAALARQASYTTLRLGLYDIMKRFVFNGATSDSFLPRDGRPIVDLLHYTSFQQSRTVLLLLLHY